MTENKVNRRDFLNLAWGVAGALAITELSLVGLRFLSPRKAEGEFGGSFNLGPVEGYPPGSVTPVEAGRFYLVRLADGGLLAAYRRCTHLGCAVTFNQGTGQFICPCHGSEFTSDGDVINPPAPRPLDLFALTITETNEILVDTGTTIERDHSSPDQIVYAGGN